jgi:hypothetical protein
VVLELLEECLGRNERVVESFVAEHSLTTVICLSTGLTTTAFCLAWRHGGALATAPVSVVIFQIEINIRTGLDEAKVVDLAATSNMTESDLLPISADVKLLSVQAAKHN